jgi:hypothetical protein
MYREFKESPLTSSGAQKSRRSTVSSTRIGTVILTAPPLRRLTWYCTFLKPSRKKEGRSVIRSPMAPSTLHLQSSQLSLLSLHTRNAVPEVSACLI